MTAAAVDAYLAAVPPARRPLVEALHALILAAYPHAEVSMQHRMPTYRVGDGWVAVANQKHHVSLYTCGEAHIAAFKDRHPHIKTGKGCINFRPADPLPTADIRDVVRHAFDHPKGG